MRRTVFFLVMSIFSLVGLCSLASAEIMGVGEVEYQYQSFGQNSSWEMVTDPGYGIPEWFTIPFSRDQWIAIPNLERLDQVKKCWLQVEWNDTNPVLPLNPIMWTSQGFTVTGGTNPSQLGNAYVWEWTITPQPGSEMIQIPASFPWADVVKISVASNCVPEPSTIMILGSLGLFGLLLVWRRRKAV